MFFSNIIIANNINVGDTISINTTWNEDTVKIISDVYIPEGITLTIAEGTYVQSQGYYKIGVDGSIIAKGTADDNIIFTAISEATGWRGIRFKNTPTSNITSVFQYCNFSYGKANGDSWIDKSGGVMLLENYSNVKILNSRFYNNYATSHGGAIAMFYSSSPSIISSEFVNNSAGSVGGAMIIYSNSNPTIINTTIANNNSSNGGAMYNSNSNGPIINCIIYGNTASSSPQIYGTPTQIENCNIEGGFSAGVNIYDTIPEFVAPTAGVGNAYAADTADYSLSSSSYLIDKGINTYYDHSYGNFDVVGNFRYDGLNADIGAYEHISSTEVCGDISTNTVWSGSILMNCDITVDDGSVLTIKPGTKIISTGHNMLDIDGQLLAQGTYDSTITITAWDKYEGWQGIIFKDISTSNDSSKIEYCVITNKVYESVGDNHGAIYVYNTNKILIRNNIIADNKGRYGGGLSIYGSSINVIGNFIGHNESIQYGAGIRLYNDNSSIINNTIANNKNLSTEDGAGVFTDGTNTSEFKNNIIYLNFDNSGNHANLDNFSTAGLDLTYSCIEGGYSGIGNVSMDPLFKNPSNIAGRATSYKDYNYFLQNTSPALDAGSSSTTGLNIPIRDIIGKTRVYNSTIDMGCYEAKALMSFGCANNTENISSNMLWDADIINIDCDITIDSGVIVTILPGTKVVFNGNKRIEILGALVANGNS
ncbi:MAG: hypothetical protein B6I18_07775, partial [Bacteroidetes bacterium 4572_112]